MPKQINQNLSEDQEEVLFNKATEAPFSGKLLNNKQSGDYMCANCGSLLFKSDTKFDSGSGWPSFYDIATASAVKTVTDDSHGMRRVEIICADCGSHLGHVFDDAHDQPTGQRYCVNSLSLDFKQK